MAKPIDEIRVREPLIHNTTAMLSDRQREAIEQVRERYGVSLGEAQRILLDYGIRAYKKAEQRAAQGV